MTDLDTSKLLQQWNRGDQAALDALFRRHEDWIRRRVRKRLGAKLRLRLESTDRLQETFLRFLKDGPRLQVEHERTFRSLMVIIIENAIRDTHAWFSRRRRDMAREQKMPDAAVIALDARRASPHDPVEIVSNAEHQAIVRLALELLKPEEQEILMLRNRDELGFTEIGQRLGIESGAADMRFRRAALRLEKAAAKIQAHEFSSLLNQLLGDDES